MNTMQNSEQNKKSGTKHATKRQERTKQYAQAVVAERMNDYVTNSIEQHNFEKLVHAGVIVRE
jgi:hypothetical protein